MPPLGGNDDAASPEATKPSRSRMHPDALEAAAKADQIPIERKWSPAWTLLLVIGVPALIWALLWLLIVRD